MLPSRKLAIWLGRPHEPDLNSFVSNEFDVTRLTQSIIIITISQSSEFAS